jgi:hypothetical protein
MTGTCAACLHTNQSRSYLNHLVLKYTKKQTTDQRIDISDFFCIGLFKNPIQEYLFKIRLWSVLEQIVL